MFRRTTAAGIAGLAALSLVAAANPTLNVGTAQTSLLGAEIEVTNLGNVPVVRVLDATTYASNDDDALRNVQGAGLPYAAAAVKPLVVGSTVIGATTAASDSTTMATNDGSTFGDALSPVGVTIAPVAANATAGDESALATVDSVTAQLGALLDAIGVDIEVTGLTSQVTQNGASAIQGVRVSDISVSLADLGIDEDLLAQLPLGALLDLLSNLPVALPADVQAVVDGIVGQLAALDDALAALEAAGVPVGGFATAVDAIQDALPALQAADDLYQAVAALPSGDLTALAAFVTGLSAGDQAALDACYSGDLLLDILDILSDPDAIIAELLSCLGAQLQSLAAPLLGEDASAVNPATALTDVLAAQDALLTAITDAVSALGVPLDDILAAVTSLLGDTSLLSGLIDDLLALLPDVAGIELLTVSGFDIGVTALATDDIGTSAAVVGCSPVDVTVLGNTFSTPDCSQGLELISDALSGLTAAVEELVGVLNTLPLANLVSVGDLTLSLFGGLNESVTSADGYVTSIAALNLLELELPSVTIDPSVILDTLAGLGLPDVLGPVNDTLTAVGDALAGVSGSLPQISDAIAVVSGLETGLSDVDGLIDTVAALTAELAALDVLSFGTLGEAVTTPGIRLAMDPTSTAQFAPGATVPVTPPAPEDPGNLPATGGGLAVLGVLTLGGALGLRRKR